MQVDTSVAEADVGKLRDGMTATFTVDAFPYERFTGRIRQIRNNSTTVQNVVTYDAVIDVENSDLRLRPGMTANVTVIIAQRPDALRISNAALRFRPPQGQGRGAAGGATGGGAAGGGAAGGKPTGHALDMRPVATDQRVVWRLKDAAIEPVHIRIGITDGTLTEIVSGDLKPGDKTVTDAGTGAPAGGGFRAF